MSRHILARNVNEGLSMALFNLVQVADRRESRNGPVMAFPYPVLTEYTHPTERVLFSPKRNANPAFHLLEALWMLRGREDVKFPATLVKRMATYSDDGETFWGAYGYRWRHFFAWDQVAHAIQELRNNPNSRRVVISMWNAWRVPGHGGDLLQPDFLVGAFGGKDVPCNTHIYLDLRDGRLNMTVCCRSNDILWGCYGANAVHFSMLQEYIAAALYAPVGRMFQLSNDLHLYTDVLNEMDITPLALDAHVNNLYMKKENEYTPVQLIAEFETVQDFDSDLELFFDRFDGRDDGNGLGATAGHFYSTQFFNFVVVNVVAAWCNRREPERAEFHLGNIGAPDWQHAMRTWVQRNYGKEKVNV